MPTLLKIMLVFTIFILVLITIVFLYIHYFIAAPGYSGPQSEHFDGRRFHNQEPVNEKGLADVIKWLTTRNKEKWEKVIDQQNQKVLPSQYVENDSVRVTFINHATLLIQTNNLNIITDPIYSERASPVEWAGPKRVKKPGISFDNVPPIHFVLISHNHYDHLDIETLEQLAERDNPKIVVPLGVGLFLQQNSINNYYEMGWWQQTAVKSGTTIHCVPAQHFSGRGITDRNKTLWAGYVIECYGKTIYFAGDTGYGAFFKSIGEAFSSIDVALLPIGAYKPHWFMSPIHISPFEAVQAHVDLNAKKTMPMHFNTFPMADEGMKEPLEDLIKAIEQKGLQHKDFIVLEEGGFFEF